jgi:ubiquinone/menaquinone biosynthesis C-methylase UbiE
VNNQYWNSLAKDFDSKVLEIAQKDFKGVLKKELRLLANKNLIAADLACGRGSLLKLLAPQFKKVYAVDYAKDLLNVAQRQFSFENVEYVKHNLCSHKFLPFKVDVTFNINALLSPSDQQRLLMAKNVYKATKLKGRSVFVVPSFESILNTYRMLVRLEKIEGKKSAFVIRRFDKMYEKEVFSSVDGIVDIGGTKTKTYTKEELQTFLKDVGYKIERVKKIEFMWDEEVKNPPRWLKDPYPWDWLVVARKIK